MLKQKYFIAKNKNVSYQHPDTLENWKIYKRNNNFLKIRSPLTLKNNDISIIIPVRNNQKGINKFLDSFFKTHNNKMYPKEIIIVDNNSKKNIIIKYFYHS